MSGTARPRVAVLSLRRIDRGPWLAQVMALEDFAVEVLDAKVIHALPPHGRLGRALAERGRVREWSSRVGLRSISMTDGPPAAPFDVLLVFANDVQQVRSGLGDVLHQLPAYARQRCLYLSEVWPSEIPRQPRAFDLVLGAFTNVFTSLDCSVQPLRDLDGADIHLLPLGVDVTQMAPWPHERPPIDVCALGRKADVQHEALKLWAARTHRFYDYDVTPPGDVPSFVQHREALANRLVHSAVWMTNAARFNDAERTRGVEEVGLRFFEALAGGCLLLGQLPISSRVFQEYFADLPGLISMPADASVVPDELNSFLEDERRLRDARIAHRCQALRCGDVSHTLLFMLDECSIRVPEALVTRVSALAHDAKALSS